MNSSDSSKNQELDIESQLKTIARRLREERERARISQMDLSFLAGLSQNQVNSIETGHRKPNLYTLLKICQALSIHPSALFIIPDPDRQATKEKIITLIRERL
jgi:transcriptional regulator with XRE-family HTH domain